MLSHLEYLTVLSVQSHFTPYYRVGILEELKAFLHWLVYISARHIPSSGSPHDIPYFFDAAFHRYHIIPDMGGYIPAPVKYYSIKGGE